MVTAVDDTAPPATSVVVTRGRLYAPLTIAVAYLGGTYLLFLLIGQVWAVSNLADLSTFIGATILALCLGYFFKIRSYGETARAPSITEGEVRSARRWVLMSSVYFVAFGTASMIAYGATSLPGVVAAITHPGTAYFAKFRVYELQQATGERNLTIQILTILAVLSTPLIPFSVVYWRRLSLAVRGAALFGACVYGMFFLFIGTLKGLGDLLVFGLASHLVMTRGQWRSARRSTSRRRLVMTAVITLGIFVGYMAYNQSDRLALSGGAARFEPNPTVAALTNEQFARGLAVVAFYPTHGYQGLAYNLQTPFTWTAGLGSSRALDGYWVQYFGGQGALQSTYPARTELRTGWPAGRLWATIYPWLASDLTFPGTVVFMGVVGWFMARFWFEAAFLRSRLALLLFCQVMLLIAYVPANNQIGAGRASLIAFLTLSVAYLKRRVSSGPGAG